MPPRYNHPARVAERIAALDRAEQAANMPAMWPYPRFKGRWFEMPCRSIVSKHLGPKDYSTSTHRGHSRSIAKDRPAAIPGRSIAWRFSDL